MPGYASVKQPDKPTKTKQNEMSAHVCAHTVTRVVWHSCERALCHRCSLSLVIVCAHIVTRVCGGAGVMLIFGQDEETLYGLSMCGTKYVWGGRCDAHLRLSALVGRGLFLDMHTRYEFICAHTGISVCRYEFICVHTGISVCSWLSEPLALPPHLRHVS